MLKVLLARAWPLLLCPLGNGDQPLGPIVILALFIPPHSKIK